MDKERVTSRKPKWYTVLKGRIQSYSYSKMRAENKPFNLGWFCTDFINKFLRKTYLPFRVMGTKFGSMNYQIIWNLE